MRNEQTYPIVGLLVFLIKLLAQLREAIHVKISHLEVHRQVGHHYMLKLVLWLDLKFICK